MKEKLTYKEYYNKILNNPYSFSLRRVPKEFRDKEMCKASIQYRYINIKHISKELLEDYNFCKELIQLNSYCISFLPEQHKTYDMYITATKNDNYFLYRNINIPIKYRTYELYSNVNFGSSCGYGRSRILASMPKDIRAVCMLKYGLKFDKERYIKNKQRQINKCETILKNLKDEVDFLNKE